MTQIAVIRIAGKSGLKKGIKDTFKMIKLYKKYSCVIIPNTKPFLGMIQKIQNYATWGEIDEPTLQLLLKKRGKIIGKKPLTDEYIKLKANTSLEQFATLFYNGKKRLSDIPGLKLFFRLKPPAGGFERKGTKKPFSLGGVWGYRKEKINELIKKMI